MAEWNPTATVPRAPFLAAAPAPAATQVQATTQTAPQTVTRTVVIKRPTQQYQPGVYREQVPATQPETARRTVVIKRPTQQREPGVYTEYVQTARQAESAARAVRVQRRQVTRVPARVGTGIGAGASAQVIGRQPVVTQEGPIETIGAWWGGANRYVSEIITTRLPLPAALYGKIGGMFATEAAKPFTQTVDIPTKAVEKATGTSLIKQSDIIGSYVGGEIEGAIAEPVTAAASFGIGLALGGTTRVAGAAVRKIPTLARTAAKPVTVLGRTTTQGALISKGITYGLGGLYGADVTVRATEGLTTSDPKTIARNVGYISSTEIGPMLAGGYVGYYAPEIGRAGVSLVKSTGIRAPDFSLRRFARGSTPIKDMSGRTVGYARISGAKTTKTGRIAPTSERYYGTVPKERSLIRITPEYSTVSDVRPGNIRDISGIKFPRDVVPVYERSFKTGELQFRGVRPSEGVFADIINVYERVPGTYAFSRGDTTVMRQGKTLLPDIEFNANLRQNQPFVAWYRATSDWMTGARLIEEAPAFAGPSSEFNYLKAFGKEPVKSFEQFDLPGATRPAKTPRTPRPMKPFRSFEDISPTGLKTVSEKPAPGSTGQIFRQPTIIEPETKTFYAVSSGANTARTVARIAGTGMVRGPSPAQFGLRVEPPRYSVAADVTPRYPGSRYSFTGKLLPRQVSIPQMFTGQPSREGLQYFESQAQPSPIDANIMAATFGTGTAIGGGDIVVPRYDEKVIAVPRNVLMQVPIQEMGLRQVFIEPQLITRNLLLTRNIFLPYTGFPGGGMGGGGGGAGGWSFRGAMDETWRLGDMFADPFGVGEYVLGSRRKRRTTTTRKRGRK